MTFYGIVCKGIYGAEKCLFDDRRTYEARVRIYQDNDSLAEVFEAKTVDGLQALMRGYVEEHREELKPEEKKEE